MRQYILRLLTTREFYFGILATVVAGVVGIYLLLRSGFIPANADTTPGGLEIWAANTSLNATLTREAPNTPNPVALTDTNLVEGVKLYGDHCAICHGTATGDASISPIAKGEYPRPPQLASDGVEDDPEGITYWKVKHGIRLTGMPAWTETLTNPQIWTLALFLKHMNKLSPAAEQAWKQVRN